MLVNAIGISVEDSTELCKSLGLVSGYLEMVPIANNKMHMVCDSIGMH